jgi:PhoH-like ATPase
MAQDKKKLMAGRKDYVLDTNVLLHDPSSIRNFTGNNIIIPMVVLEELDKLKKGLAAVQRAARQVIRYLDAARQLGNLSDGVYLEEDDVFIRVDAHTRELVKNIVLDKEYNDNIILEQVSRLTAIAKDKHKTRPILVTKDIALRVKASALGLKVEDYEASKIKNDDLFDPMPVFQVSDADINAIYTEAHSGGVDLGIQGLPDCSYGIFQGPSTSCLAITKTVGNASITYPINNKTTAYKLKPINSEQYFAMDALLDKNVSVIALTGVAGTGKTLLALAAALEMVLEKQLYKKIIVSKIPVSVGKELGYLPGNLKEKMDPLLASFHDSYEFLNSKNTHPKMKGKAGFDQLESLGHVEIQAIQYIRGRSINDSIIILDEAQQANPHEILTIVSRLGKNSKIILTGDPFQIDTPNLDAESNGLSVLIDKFSDDEEARKLFRHIHLTQAERSKVAEIVTRLL